MNLIQWSLVFILSVSNVFGEKVLSIFPFKGAQDELSSFLPSLSSYQEILTDKDWKSDSIAQTRCSLINKDTIFHLTAQTLKEEEGKACFNPFSLTDAIIKVPNNTTRIDKDGISLCQIETGQYTPSIVVYVYDHSGSMGPNRASSGNDPKQIADDAFRKAIGDQAQLDSRSFAAYIPFDSEIIMGDTVHPIQLNSQGNMDKIQAKINHEYGGNTNFFDPLLLAVQFLEKAEFDGFNKSIIMLADGQDRLSQAQTDSLVLAPDIPPIYGIFLGLDPLGRDRMDFISSATGGYSTQIDDADGVAPIISQLIRDLVVVANPINMTLENMSLSKVRFSTFDQMSQQLDGSWVLNFNNDIPLKEYTNIMSLRTTYEMKGQKIQSDPIIFTIQVTSDIVNQDVDIKETPFVTQCSPLQTIEVYTDQLHLLGVLDNRVDSLLIRFNAMSTDNMGDSVTVWVISKETKDTALISLMKVFDNDTINTYEGYINTQWVDQVPLAARDRQIVMSPYDEIIVKKLNEIDPRDIQRARFDVRISPRIFFEEDTLFADSIPLSLHYYSSVLSSIDVQLFLLDTTLTDYSLRKKDGADYHFQRIVSLTSVFTLKDIPADQFELVAIFTDPINGLQYRDTALVIPSRYFLDSQPMEIVLYDGDQDTRLDSILISFSDSINKVMKESFSYTLTWPNRQGSIREIAIDAESMSDESSSTLSDQIEYSIQEGWGLSHHFTGLDSTWGEVNLTQEYADDFGVITREWNNLPIRDSMAPVLVSSEIVWREDDANKDELVITFSEKLDTNITNVDQLFNFVVGTHEQSVYYGKDFEWRENGKVFVIFFSGDGLDHSTHFYPRDRIKALVGEGYLEDLNGLAVGNSESWTNIDGGFNVRVEYTQSSVFDLTDDLIDREDIETEVFQLHDNVIEIMERRHEQGMVIGPIKVNESDSRPAQEIRWRYQFMIFDHLGQFVTRKYGVIECTSQYFQTNDSRDCKDSRGLKIGLKWNYKTIQGRFVGTGVYILALQIENRRLVTHQVAVRRMNDLKVLK